ncbi:MAG: hypothetical protein QF441_03575 [Bacteriovoracaceae bacterium]|jgi:hypothetical protein|nr:hypothetical protein [Bacteriovoracaceae bacterium]
MKKLMTGLALLTSLSVHALKMTTQEYDVNFHSRYSDSRGKDTACSVSVIEGKDLLIPEAGIKVIRIEAVGTGRWIDLSLPTQRLPLVEGADFLVKSVTGDKRVTYKNGVLSYQIDDVEDKTVSFYKHGIADLEIDPNLSYVKMVDASKVSIKKSFFGRIKVIDLMNIQCAFL